ncbi:MAG: tetratricopeptide repeat protein [Thalassospira sp.]|uniref:tetratricopeptide repeat protein n=1 Tax=Thalassospira sp. TaxID=1912094 RepID=UPI003A83F9E3
MKKSDSPSGDKKENSPHPSSNVNSPPAGAPIGNDEIQELLVTARGLHAAGDLTNAVAIYSRVLSIDPQQPTAMYLLGVAFLQSGNHQKAIDFLRGSLSVSPQNAEANNNLGVAFFASGNNAAAEAAYRRAISIKPSYAAAYKNLGALLATTEKLDESLQCYQKAVDLAPNNLEAHKAIGDLWSKLQNYENALQAYLKANALAPMDADILTSLGITLQLLSRYQEAIKLHSQAVNMAPDEDRHWSAFSDCVAGMTFTETNDNLETSLLRLLEKTDLSPASLMFPIVSALRHRKEFADLLDHSADLPDGPDLLNQVRNIVGSNLFISLLKRVPVADLRVERLLTGMRRALLSKASRDESLSNEHAFIAALAHQCFINEYAYFIEDEERAELEKLISKVETELSSGIEVQETLWMLIGCYVPLKAASWNSLIKYPSKNSSASAVFDLQITAPATEKALGETIPTLSEIADPTSQTVRAQYEENPYPRWIHTSKLTAKPIKEVLCSAPLSFDLKGYTPPAKLETLVAGCGTGQHAIQAASRFTNTSLVAVDLSLSSLSYALRKSREMNVSNIDYIQGDILELEKLDRQFDVIECGGVLHHMADPIKGWSVLVNILRPGGLMKIGLYSEKGRPDIIAGREFIEKGGYGSTPDQMRKCRQDIIAAAEQGDPKLIQLCMRGDFYSLSPCRDLIFHVQEHRFTIPEISDALKKLKLEFIGFETPTPQPLVQFRKEHPSCAKSIELDLWHKFEERYPDTFRGMYQFWCRKPSR